jgi:5-(carboxyamino)imidazole ribonucleotide mutase
LADPHRSAPPLVGILVGSASDLPIMEQAAAMLERFEIPHELEVMSAHRNPDQVDEYARLAEERGLRVLICGAGMAAHLAGAVAARTILPVIGVPLGTKYIGGADALYSTAQMPRGVPVATVAIDGAQNAALLAAQIIACTDEDLRVKLRQFKQSLAEGLKL